MVEYACAEARRYGLEAWLYDEYPYPSGMSGGEVLLEHPEAEHMILVHKKVEKSRGGEVEVNLGWSRVLFAKAYVAFILEVPAEEWVKRVQHREEVRFGSRVMSGGDMYEQQKAFREIIGNEV